ncbi:MAG: sugar-transfer associated ATP-grasp domain-containing protein [bacterium]
MAKSIHKQAGQVLGFNARALKYTTRDSETRATAIARDKLASKRILQKAGLPTPRLYASISSRQELKRFRWTKLPSSFVLKPRSAYGGGGIVIIFGRNKKGNWVKADKTEVFIPELKKHALDILDGNFSPSNVPDTVFFEQRIKNHPDLKQHSYRGIADIRIIVYNLVPVMAMLRLPTIESHGRSNLHAGGIGVGVDLARGVTTNAIHHGQPIETLPNRRLSLAGLLIPHWPAILLTSVKAAQAVNLPFAGVDIAIDRDDGPLILEINARPGLDIQLANMTPLRSRLARVDDLTVTSPAKGVQIGKNLFGSDMEQEIEDLTGRPVLNVTESVQIIAADGTPHLLTSKIDTGAWRTTIDTSLASQLGLNTKIITHNKVRGALGKQERPIIDLPLTLRDKPIKTRAYLTDRSHMKYPIIIGRRDLKGFLVNPG